MSDKYGRSQDALYCYPHSNVLINKLGLTEADALQAAEIELTQTRISQYEPDFNNISFSALRAIHFHLFQDLYNWAGELRTIDISKGSTRFANVNRIEPEANNLFRQLKQEAYLIGLPREQFVARLAHYYGELNVIHPFRDGNGRAQRLLFEVLSINAGYALRWEPIRREEWVGANIAAYNCQLAALTALLDRAFMPI
ncbi:putative adenosine monophosphate-protein transferase Fic [Pseudoduganella violacea]|uniref:protein adenylyltransferase n=1 Tax=Pseudoduganella violacea TaxID=1715466 RepID=A0A7W5B6T7_9BURK|nr:putative adenosine monophosphate-protein transferase Fic [Pseudoduganella violacea]MBB3117235.1 cell filamentation protein [Pseudoduganella violacea]